MRDTRRSAGCRGCAGFDTFSKPFKIEEYFPSQAPVFVWRLIQCRSGGIGRRAWFRSMYSQGCGGSSPFFGTISFVAALQTALTVLLPKNVSALTRRARRVVGLALVGLVVATLQTA